jgi:cytochrome b pre-mRNA-processing protein 3
MMEGRPGSVESSMFFKRFFNPTANAKTAREIYLLIVAKARQPYFYAELGVPDTVDGRFDMITLHAILVIEFIAQGGKASKALSQQLFDEMFADMDRSLREMGAGDLSVGKKVRKMAEVFYGRAKAYREALAHDDEDSLTAALARNVYGGEGHPENAHRLARYALAAAKSLSGTRMDDVHAHALQFPDPQTIDSCHEP